MGKWPWMMPINTTIQWGEGKGPQRCVSLRALEVSRRYARQTGSILVDLPELIITKSPLLEGRLWITWLKEE